MSYTDKDIEEAINKVKHKAFIAREFDGFIILAQSERDYETKRRKILRGDTKGFYTVKRAQKL